MESPFRKSVTIVVPVYNRPDELDALLKSMVHQTNKEFEVIIVEDGSDLTCEDVVRKYNTELAISYYYKPNSGPGPSRNFGYEKAKGDFCIFLDSDCVLPINYFETFQSALKNNQFDLFGGPDKAHYTFSLQQKAINYSMTSFLTTGGIRGKQKSMGKFYPRSFNMGFSRQVLEKAGGFSEMRYGEDIDMSLRAIKHGFKPVLISDAYVYHKRKTSLRSFFSQVFNFGKARIELFKKHPESKNVVYFFPVIFIMATIVTIPVSLFYSSYFFLPFLLHTSLIFIDSSINNRNLSVGFLSVLTSYVQITAYGMGMCFAFVKKIFKPKVLRSLTGSFA